ncbi:HDIG domain-containing protein [Peribacillus saganii]|uniref:HDIG domain-containing protein n=1 Tax=Peribacillus saganii TaxID=2303992 RepID=A0A372LU32_9BACI|nr:HDIG domain-containing protein [Peribacillus saganii]
MCHTLVGVPCVTLWIRTALRQDVAHLAVRPLPGLLALFVGGGNLNTINAYLTKLKDLLGLKVFQIVLLLFLGVFSYAVMYSNVKPEKITVELFKPAEQTIIAGKTVEDTYKTEQEKNDTVKQVSDVYTLKKEYAQNKVDLVDSIFDSAIEVMNETPPAHQKPGDSAKPDDHLSTDKKVELLKGKLTDEVNNELPSHIFTALVEAAEADLQIAKDVTVTVVNNVMSTRIPADEVENAKKRAEEELRFSSLKGELKAASIALARNVIIQNVFFDREKTEEQRQEALESVEPVKILQGQIIVVEGQLVDREIYRKLELTGVLEGDKTIQPFVGLAIIIILTVAALYYFFNTAEESNDFKTNHLIIFIVVFLIAISIMKTISLFSGDRFANLGYFFPAAMASMIIKILSNERYAAAATILLAGFGTIIFNEGSTGVLDIPIGLYILFSGMAGIIILTSRNFKARILPAGLALSFVNFALILAFLFISDGQYSKMEFLYYFAAALLSGLLSSVLTIGLLPFFEAGFGILSTMKLIELSNPNHPLLRKILTESPGTYHHSIMVANLAESACEAIGANGLLARVGCYYHDIGKTKRPQFFIENQMNIDNPHDRLPPATSRDIIIAHATDGAEILRKHRLPREIVDIAEQHHGTTLLKYFYHKATKLGEDVNEDYYRYPGPKAQTKEIAVIGIADSVEAAVRSMAQPTAEKIENLVVSIISDRLHDHQFNECDITMRELQIVKKSLCETLNGIFHSRIEYPEFQKTEQKVKI